MNELKSKEDAVLSKQKKRDRVDKVAKRRKEAAESSVDATKKLMDSFEAGF